MHSRLSAETYDAAVVGAGPAGLSAATWLARYRRSTIVVDSEEYRNRRVDQSPGFLGSDPADPMSLLRRARRDLDRYPTVRVVRGRASTVGRDRSGAFLLTVDGEERRALRLVLATGVVDQFPDVDRFFDHYGADVFHCPTCDGYEAAGRRIVVFGWSEDIAGFALSMLEWAASITVVTDGRTFEGEDRHRQALIDNGVHLVEDDAVALVGRRGALESVRLRGGTLVEAELAFFSIAHHPRLDLAEQLGCEITDDGCLVVDDDGQTSVAGVYAAGDITPGFQLAAVAAGKGAVAGVACASSLKGALGAAGSPSPGPDPEAELSR
ncbi:MAG: NAD(P)/FAD-dependent oxidoreductase [Actinomycetota bacterium]|nr:NAD(P)/FAD-dependent oxidoreductase [Actinomycetota bacterium]